MQPDSLALCRSLAAAGLLRGLIALNPNESLAPFIERMTASVPTLLFDPAALEVEAIRYVLDNRGGIRALMEHLWDRGYRDYLWLDGDVEAAWDARERFDAFDSFLDEKGLPRYRRLRAVGGFKTEVAEKSVAAILARGPAPRAIVAANDESAIGALNALRRFGLEAPRDVAVAGFDGLRISAWLQSPLTTLAYDRKALGERMADSVVGALDGGARNSTTLVGLTLLARETT